MDIMAADDSLIEWRWTRHASCDCRIVADGDCGPQAERLLDHALLLLRSAMIDDTPPDFTEIARVVWLALGDCRALIELRGPTMPGWWFRV
jgi:hypothetical protein